MIKQNDGCPASQSTATTSSIDASTQTIGELLSELKIQSDSLHRTQAELKAARDIFNEFYDSVPVSYLTLDLDGLIVMSNYAASELLGVNRENLWHTPFVQFIADADHGKWTKFFLGVLRNDQPKSCDFQLQRFDGSIVYALIDTQVQHGNNIHSVRITVSDFTEKMQVEARLHESELKLRVIFEGALDGILLVNAITRRFVSGNPAICRMLGYSAAELTQLEIADVHRSEDLPRISEQFEKHMRGEAKLAEDIPFKRCDGSVFYADITSAPVLLNGNTYLVGIIRDITERKQMDEFRCVSALKYELLFESSRDALMILEPPSWRFTAANEATLHLFGATSVAEFTSLGPWDISPEVQPDGCISSSKAQKMISIAMSEGAYLFEWEHQRLNGKVFAAEVLLTRMQSGDELFLQATVRDITERKQAEREHIEAQILADNEKKFRQLAFYDALTLLPNRRLLNDRLAQARAASKRSNKYCALMFVDLDNFKPLNDRHGHDVGDLLLIEVAHRVTCCLREMDTVARFGGDEFVVLLSELDVDYAQSMEQARIVAEKIRMALAESYRFDMLLDGDSDPIEHRCTSSIGLVVFINHENTPEEILKWADMAMYQAKENGRNRVKFFDPNEV